MDAFRKNPRGKKMELKKTQGVGEHPTSLGSPKVKPVERCVCVPLETTIIENV